MTHYVKRDRTFQGPLYKPPVDSSTARTKRAWQHLGSQLKEDAQGFLAMGARLYYPHEVYLPKVLRA